MIEESNPVAVEAFHRRNKAPDLVLSRVPPNTLSWFLSFCSNEEFCSDRGFALRELINAYKELQSYKQSVPNLAEVLEGMQSELNELKEKKQESSLRRSLNGRILGKKED